MTLNNMTDEELLTAAANHDGDMVYELAKRLAESIDERDGLIEELEDSGHE